MSSPYLPYLLQAVVTKVNTTFSTRATDPFNVFFDRGLYVDVSKKIYKDITDLPLVWLVTNSVDFDRTKKTGYYADASFDLIIAMPTQSAYTQQERETNTFQPRLYPIYEEVLKEFSNVADFGMPSFIPHHLHERPYWGGGQGGVDNKNLFEKYIDALHMTGIKLKIKNQKCS